MNEIFKGFITGLVCFIIWSAFCFWLGFLYHARTDENINERDNQHNQQQQELDNQIATTTGTISNINNDIREQIYISTRATANIQELIEDIQRQRINL